ncbi:MAG: DUF308 domain-containing protein [Lachnospiraceae bacterium]|nr:DUF308 domain-containing protein [Lachnospiraceae bacterium]
MKKLKEISGSLVMSLCEIMIGFFLLINPVRFTSLVIIALGVLLVVRGIASIISYFRTSPEMAAGGHDLSSGCICLAGGLFCICRSEWFIATFPVLTFLYGIIILLGGMMKIQWAVDAIRMKRKQCLPELASAILSLICAAVIIINPFSSTAVLWTFAAVFLIATAIFDIVAAILGSKKE